MSKILIVDDDVTITELLKTLVRMDGHAPTTINDSTRAIELARSVRPDLITLDLMIFDVNDHIYDSDVLLDHFRWTTQTNGPAGP